MGRSGKKATGLRLTADVLRLAYDYLNSTEPFCRWNLPDGEDIKLIVVRDPTLYGWHTLTGKSNTIGISANTVTYTDTLMRVLAHEMVHLHQSQNGMARAGVLHGRGFKILANEVCRIHGFDPGAF